MEDSHLGAAKYHVRVVSEGPRTEENERDIAAAPLAVHCSPHWRLWPLSKPRCSCLFTELTAGTSPALPTPAAQPCACLLHTSKLPKRATSMAFTADNQHWLLSDKYGDVLVAPLASKQSGVCRGVVERGEGGLGGGPVPSCVASYHSRLTSPLTPLPPLPPFLTLRNTSSLLFTQTSCPRSCWGTAAPS